MRFFQFPNCSLLQRQLWIWIHLSALDEGIIATCCVDVPEALKSTEGKVQFLMECLGDLKQSMRKRGPRLPILHDAFEAHSLNMLFQEDLCHATLARCRPSPLPLATAAGGSCLAATGDRTWGTLS